MAFNIDYMARVSTSANSDSLKVWVYNGTSTGSNETAATIVASAYFNSFQQNLTSGSTSGPLVVDDVILVHGSDASGWYKVSSITTNVTLAAFLADGVVQTVDIADNAVTSAKLADVIALGADAVLGSLTLFAPTTASGTLRVLPVDSSSDVQVTISNADHAQATVVSIPDGGQATTEFIIADSAGTQNITSGSLAVNDGNITAGSDANAGWMESHPATTASGTLRLAAVNSSADALVSISNADHGQSTVVSIPDAGAATANFLLDAGAANIIAHQQFVGIESVLTFGTGTWTTTRVAQGDYVSRHTEGDETSIIGVDVTPMIRAAASKGFRLDSFDYIYAINDNTLDAHTVVLDRIEYANNVAVSVNTIAITGTLATTTQGNPYVTNVSVDTPAFDITADSKYVIEITANNSATSEYDFIGVMLRFSETIGQ